MIGETYHIETADDLPYYFFLSEGSKGIIVKAVIYSLDEGDTWNLGFGDFKNGTIDGEVVSDNADLVKVLNTVAETVYLFTEKHLERKVIIRPVDEKRSRLYHHVFRRHFEEMKTKFEVQGFRDGKWEKYQPQHQFQAFLLKRFE